MGFEPTNKGFADLRLRPLGHVAKLKNELNKYKKIHYKKWILLERETGLEPATSTLARLRSTN